jgi:hypothetical protein
MNTHTRFLGTHAKPGPPSSSVPPATGNPVSGALLATGVGAILAGARLLRSARRRRAG